MLALNKTKAALQSCQCHYEKPKQIKHTRVNAGGQRLSVPVITGTVSMARLRETTQKLGCLGCTALAHTPFPQIWGELEQSAGCTAMQHTPENSRSFDRYPDIGYHSLSASLAFLRWRRLISPLAAVTRNAAVLSPSSLRRSISSITSWGILIVVICDFAFFAPVAITVIPCVRCISVYAKKMRRKDLRCISLWSSFNSGGDIHLSNAKPGSARNTNRASNQTVNRGNSNGFH